MMTAAQLQRLVLGTGLCVLAVALPAHAQWKWKDERGQVQYSDLPPPKGTPPERILQRPVLTPPKPVVVGASAPLGSASAPGAAASAPVDPALQARRKQAEQEEAAKRQADEARNAQVRTANCERARGALRSLESGERLARVNAKGEREFVDERTREQEAQQARQIIASDCR